MLKTYFRMTGKSKWAVTALAVLIAGTVLIPAGASANTTGRIKITAESAHQQILDWGYDIKQGGKATGLTTALAQELFIDDQMNILRIPIYAENAHPSAGVVDGSYYTDIVDAVLRVKAVKSSVKVFASLKLDGTNTFPAWVKNADGTVKAQEYATLLYDFLNYMKSQQITVDVLGDDNEQTFNKGGITPSKHNTIVGDLQGLCSANGIAFPQMIGPEDFGPSSYTWLDSLFAGGWGSSIDYAGVHYYSKSRTSAYAAKLQQFSQSAGSKTLWDSEFHWSNLGVGEYDNARYGLIAAFDHFDNLFQGMSWWSFNPESKGTLTAQMQTALVTSTVNAYPVDGDDQDGSAMDLGMFNTRSFKQGRDLVLWVINDTASDYSGKWIEIPGKTISTTPTFTQWNNTAQSTGTAVIVNSDTIKTNFPSKTVTMIRIPNLYDTEVDDTAATYTGSGWSFKTIRDNFGGGNHATSTAGDYATYTFTGTGIDWVGSVANNHGKADVYIDGVLKQTVDSYNSAYLTQQVLFSISGLSNGSHTIKIQELSGKNASSSGHINNIDAFYVR